MKKVQLILILSLFVGFFVCIPAYAGQKITQSKLPESLTPGLQHLLALADHRQRQQFDSAQITEVLNFIETSKNPNVRYYAAKQTGSPSAYYDFDVQRSLADILKYAFNPDIPGIQHKFVKGLKSRADAEIYRKSGTWKHFHADSGIIVREKHKYIVVALTEHARGAEGLTRLVIAVDDMMERLRPATS